MASLPQEQIQALEILGHVYFLQGRPREARIVFNGLLALDEANASALKHLAALDLEEGQSGKALRLLDDYARRAQEAPPALWLMRAQALEQSGRKDEARQTMAEYLARAAKPSTT